MKTQHPNAKDLTEQRFGRLTAIEPTDKRSGRGIIWKCICDCGNECFVVVSNLCNGSTKSCGCLNRDQIIERNLKHGMSDTSVHNAWKNMLRRCEDPKNPGYKWYGGRGISVSEEFHDFKTWHRYIGSKPGPKYSQDRIDNDGNYERGNIRWATWKEQRASSRLPLCGYSGQYWFFAFNLNTGEWDEDNSQRDFAKRHKMNRWTVGSCIRGQQTQHRGWIFNILR